MGHIGDIGKLPPKDTPSGWVPLSELSVMGIAPHTNPASKFDWVVVGAGFTGLAAARRLAELNPEHSIALIEAMPIGWGASGRNSGFVIDLPHKFDLDSDDKERLSAILRLNTTALADLEQHTQNHQIECEWSKVGKLQAAMNERGTAKMQGFMKALDRINVPYSFLDRDALRSMTGTGIYTGAVHTSGGVLMNPVKLARGLAGSMPENVQVMDGCPVINFSRGDDFNTLTLRYQGVSTQIQSPKTLLCTNAFTSEFGFLKNRMAPVITFASITRPLTNEEMTAYGGELDWGLTPADPGGTTLRMTQDRRLLIRNQYDYAGNYGAKDEQLEKIVLQHRASFLARYPQLEAVPFVSTWGGICGLSRNHVSFFGQVANNVWNSSCHNGVGVARGTISGRLMAEAASGQRSSLLEDMEKVSGQPALNPPDPFLGLGVRTRLKLAAWQSREEV
ncbi:FAD-binding oxidoreductase [Pseudovibrio sp. FO-BEG1]|uniref:NAD(P)/FAD-dependent oxidoreductase n=1 Tax=Pseudovibrio sp. (strain FO-BEG1) TaxID=911045 RepID=UPI0011D2755E|nr:FAD-dependent oxidoreductase [Pseudovibrio sp. FO-BEG1]